MSSNIGNSVVKNTSVMFGAQFVTWISSFILLLFLPRYLGTEDFGRLYLAISMSVMIGIIIDFGGHYLIPKEISRAKEKTPRILISYLGVRSILWVLCMVLLGLFSWLAGYPPIVNLLILILGFEKLFEAGVQAIRSCFQGHEMMEFPSVGVIAQKIFISVLAVVALLMGGNSVVIALIMVAGMLINLLIGLKFVPRIVSKLPKFDLSISVDFLKNSIPYFLWSVFAVIYYRIDAVMLSTMTNESVVGWYGGAYRFFDIVMFLPSIITTVLFPIFSKLSSVDVNPVQMRTPFQKSIKYMILAGIPMGLLFLGYSHNIIDLFYGLDEYGPSVVVLQIFSLGIIFVYIDFILGSAILASNKQRNWAAVGAFAIVINLGLNYLFIPYAQAMWDNGGIGAATSTLVTEIYILVAALWILPYGYFKGFDKGYIYKSVFSGAVMALIIWGTAFLSMSWIIKAGMALLAYALLIISIRLIEEDEITFIREYFQTKITNFKKAKMENL